MKTSMFSLVAAVVLVISVAMVDRAINPSHRWVSVAEAVVGRPLTPVSVAGVARRTSRRCAAGVYNC